MSIYGDVTHHLSFEIPQGTMFSSKHLLHLASRRNVDRELVAYARVGWLLRVGHGTYYKRYWNVDTVPRAAEVARFRMESRGEIVQDHGADTAARFGVADPEAGIPRFYTSGRTRTVGIGSTAVRFQHVPGVVLVHPGTMAGDALAALHHLGAGEAAVRALPVIRAQLPETDRQRLRRLLPKLPDRWVAAWLRLEPDYEIPLPRPIGPGRPSLPAGGSASE